MLEKWPVSTASHGNHILGNLNHYSLQPISVTCWLLPKKKHTRQWASRDGISKNALTHQSTVPFTGNNFSFILTLVCFFIVYLWYGILSWTCICVGVVIAIVVVVVVVVVVVCVLCSHWYFIFPVLFLHSQVKSQEKQDNGKWQQ